MREEKKDYTWEESTIESIKELAKNTPEGGIIPSEVGLPEDKYEGTDADHPWFELHEDDFSKTDDDVTLNIKPEELVEKFLQRYLAWRNPEYSPSYCF